MCCHKNYQRNSFRPPSNNICHWLTLQSDSKAISHSARSNIAQACLSPCPAPVRKSQCTNLFIQQLATRMQRCTGESHWNINIIITRSRRTSGIQDPTEQALQRRNSNLIIEYSSPMEITWKFRERRDWFIGPIRHRIYKQASVNEDRHTK